MSCYVNCTIFFLSEQTNKLFDTDQIIYVVFFILLGLFFFFIGIYLSIKTFKQFRSNQEVLTTDHSNLGVYNNVRNPYYSSVFLISSGILLMTSNFLSFLIIGVNWLILTLVIITVKEAKYSNKSDTNYLKHVLRVNRLIPWFNQYFEINAFNSKDQIYLEQAGDFLNKELIAPVMGIYSLSLPKLFWFRKGVCFVSEQGISFYSYDVFRGHYGQLIAFDKISSFVYGRGTLGYSLKIHASNTSINLYFIKKGDVEEFIKFTKKRIKV
ncbi:methyltransferase [Alkalibacterium gilvum]|uniref:methyltransferase n=1 Tax=Alkalibacterium gilvum TaxID=1130080 RepID=UPI003F926807